MATIESMMMRCNAALVRIEDVLLALEGSEALKADESRPIRRVYRDREMLRVMQLEALANWIEEIASKPALNSAPAIAPKLRKPRKPRPVKPKAI